MREKKRNGLFSLDFEESFLMMSRLAGMRKKLAAINRIAINVLKFGVLRKSEKNSIEDIKRISGEKDTWEKWEK